ncbi:MAG: hypothetical protein Q9168_001680 [Polycauliona sp. 1 TL-2023]
MAERINDVEDQRQRRDEGAGIEGANGVVARNLKPEELTAEDAELATKFGYQPVFKRQFGYLSTFSFAVSISGLFSSVATTFSYPLRAGGHASSEYGAAQLLLAAISIGSDFTYFPTRGMIIGVMAALTVLTGLVNSLSTYWMEKMTKYYVVFHMAVLVSCSVALLAKCENRHDAKYVFTDVKATSGWTPQSLGRTLFAFSRDRLIPFSGIWLRMDSRTQTPLYAVWICVVWAIMINLVGLGSYAAIVGVFATTAIALDWSYCVPIVCKMLFGQFEAGPWHMGKWSWWVNAYAVAWTLFASIIYLLPTVRPVSLSTMNYAVAFLAAILVCSAIFWYTAGRKYYTGPLVEAEMGKNAFGVSGNGSDSELPTVQRVKRGQGITARRS